MSKHKKTVWNASLEEGTGLVTDRYIQTSMEDIEKNGYGKKIIGFLTVNLFMYLITFIGRYVDSQIILTLFKSTEVLVSIPFFLGLLVTLLYFISLKKSIKNESCLTIILISICFGLHFYSIAK